MFMDPSAFEADDIERELRDAGLEPEAQPTTTSREGERHEDPLLNPGKRNDASPSCGSSYGLSSAGVPDGRDMSGGGGDGGGNRGWEEPKKHGEPRALTENLDSGSRQRQSAPTFGRYSIGGGGKGEPRSGAQRRSQNSPPPPSTTPPLGSASPLLSGGGGSYGFRNEDGGDEGKSQEDSTETVVTTGGSTASSATGVRSRARVLAQQREIQRKKRQQALSSGGIRASDAASLSRGLVSGGPGIASRRSSADEVGVGPGEGYDGAGNNLDHHSSLLDGNRDDDQDETSNAFSPSVKQFSAPRQVEGDAYTAFNANSPRPHAGGANLSSMSSEFERRRSITQHGLGGDSDDTEDDQHLGSSGGPRRRRNKNKAAPDMGNRSADGGGSPKGTTPDEQSNGGHKTGHPRGEESRRSKSRPDDWDDRNRPSTKTYKWGRESDEASDGADKSNGNGNGTWRSVGRDVGSKSPPRQNPPTGSGGRDREAGRVRRDQHHQPRSNRTKKHDFDGGGDRSLGGSEEERGTPDENSESSRSYIGSSGSSSESSRNEKSSTTGGRSSDPRLDSRRSRHHRRGDGSSDSGSGTSLSQRSRSSSRSSGASASDVAGERSAGRKKGGGGRRGRPPRSRPHGDKERGGGGRSNPKAKGSAAASAGGGSSSRRRERSGTPSSSPLPGGAHDDRGRRSRGRRDDSSGSPGRSGRRRGRRHRSHSASNSGGNSSSSSSSSRRRRRSGDGPGKSNGRADGGQARGGSSRNRRDGNKGRSEAVYDEGERSAHRSKGPGEEKRMEDQEEAKNSGRNETATGETAAAAAPAAAAVAAAAGAAAGAVGGREGPRPRGDGVSAAAPSGALAGAGTNAGAGPRASASGGDVEFNMAAIDLSDMKRFLLSPCPRAAGVVQCYIRRNKTRSNKLFPEYSLFMKEGDRFLMCSKKRPNNATSNYLISMRAGDLDRNSTNFLGKLRANFVGTEFQVYDNGYNPKEQPGTFGGSWGTGNHSGGGRGSGVGNEPMREELGCIMYASNVLGSRGPRKMQVAIPTVTETGVVSKWSELDGGRGSQTGGGGSKAIDRVKNRDYDGSIYMVNKPPRWNDQVGAYVLNFYGRVTMASVKNFQLVSTEDFDRIILQFGRVARDEFTMDFQYPITPFQAFAITLSSFDSKIACD